MRLNYLLFLVAVVWAAGQPLFAQTGADKPAPAFLAQPVRFIVPNAPGGPTDTVARIVGQKLAERLGVAVIVDNRGGASGTVGGDLVANSPEEYQAATRAEIPRWEKVAREIAALRSQ